MKTEIMAKIDNFIEANQKQFFRDIARLVAINSVEKLGENGTPSGSGPKRHSRHGPSPGSTFITMPPLPTTPP